MTMSMIPGSWYGQRPPQRPGGLTLAQAASPFQLQTLPAYPQAQPQPALAPVTQTLMAPPEENPLEGTIQDRGWLFRSYSDDELMNMRKYPFFPDNYSAMQPGDSDRLEAELKLRGLVPDLDEMNPLAQNPYERRGNVPVSPGAREPSSPESDPALTDLMAGLGGITSTSSSMPAIPGLPPRPDFGQESPDFGAFPEAPFLVGPDYSAANAYFEAAKPTPYEADSDDMALSVLAGAAQGFSPYGSVGEILGRMAGPGMQGGLQQRKEDKALSRQYDRDLAAWNAAMGGQAGDQAAVQSDVAATNAQNLYQNAVGKYQDAQTRYQMAREDERWQAGYDLQRAGAELQRAQLEMQRPYYDARAAYYASGGGRGGAGGLSMGSVMKTISDGVNMGALPGIEGINEQLEATKQALLAGAQENPNQLALYMGDPKQLDMDARRKLTEQIFLIAQQNPELMQELLLASMKGKTGVSMEDVIMGLQQE